MDVAAAAGKIFLASKHVAWTWVFVYLRVIVPYSIRIRKLDTDKKLDKKQRWHNFVKVLARSVAIALLRE